jgi:hypothetical protein
MSRAAPDDRQAPCCTCAPQAKLYLADALSKDLEICLEGRHEALTGPAQGARGRANFVPAVATRNAPSPATMSSDSDAEAADGAERPLFTRST